MITKITVFHRAVPAYDSLNSIRFLESCHHAAHVALATTLSLEDQLRLEDLHPRLSFGDLESFMPSEVLQFFRYL